MALPHGSTFKIPTEILTLLQRDADKEDLNKSDILRRILKRYYKKQLGAK